MNYFYIFITILSALLTHDFLKKNLIKLGKIKFFFSSKREKFKVYFLLVWIGKNRVFKCYLYKRPLFGRKALFSLIEKGYALLYNKDEDNPDGLEVYIISNNYEITNGGVAHSCCGKPYDYHYITKSLYQKLLKTYSFTQINHDEMLIHPYRTIIESTNSFKSLYGNTDILFYNKETK